MKTIDVREQMYREVNIYAKKSSEKAILAEYVRMHELVRNLFVSFGGKAWDLVGVLASDGSYYKIHVSGNNNYDGDKFNILMEEIENRFRPLTVFCVYH